MITELHIKNIGIIDEINIDFERGFNCLTGETGAGKTLIIDSIQILSGNRFSKEMMRNESEFSFIELALLEGEETIIVSREINKIGKNICKIDGRMVSVNELKDFMQKHVQIHGQRDNQTLFEKSEHISFVDLYSKNEIKGLKEEYLNLFNEFKEIEKDFKNNYGDESARERELDLLKYQLNEMSSANLKQGEDIELEEKKQIMVNSEKISKAVDSLLNAIDSQVVYGLENSLKALEKISSIGEKYNTIFEKMQSIYYEMEEIGSDAFALREESYFDERERNELEDRLDLIHNLKRKYGNTIEEILNYKEEVESRINKIENIDDYIAKLNLKKQEVVNKMTNIALKMNSIRKQYAIILEEKINKELEFLDMKNAEFKVDIKFDENQNFNTNGLDSIEFLIKTNIGDEFKPLVKIASGGEASRIMLAIKTVLAEVDTVGTLVFDEIDTGISGVAGANVARKIKEVSKFHQVIIITHLAQIAAKADANFYIKKAAFERQNENKHCKVIR
jgi:DNA repair protein RecN (Recombination protein N)